MYRKIHHWVAGTPGLGRPLFVGAGLIALALAGAGAWWMGNLPPKDQAAAEAPGGPAGQLTANQIQRLGITTEAVKLATDVPLGSVAGTVTLPPEARVAVTAPFAGAILRLYVVQGQAVTRGQPLAVVRSRDPVQFGAELARARARLGLTQATAARTSQLAQEGIVADARADEAQAAMRVAQADVAENARVLNQSGASASGELVLRAPITGRVAAVNIQTGGPVDGMTAPFVVENTSALMLDLQIPERLANSVHAGMAVDVPLANGEVVPGSIISVGGSIDPATRSVLAKARLSASSVLVSGKSVTATLKGTAATSGASIPTAAVTRLGDKDVVFVQTPKGFVARPVEIVSRASDRVVVSGGIAPGERVATTGISELKVILGGK